MVATFAETQRNKHAVTPSALRRDLNLNIYPTSFTPPPHPTGLNLTFPSPFSLTSFQKLSKLTVSEPGGDERKKDNGNTGRATCLHVQQCFFFKERGGRVGCEYVCNCEKNEKSTNWEIKTKNKERKKLLGGLSYSFSPFLCLPLAGMWEWLRGSAGCTCVNIFNSVYLRGEKVYTSVCVHVWYKASPVFSLLQLHHSFPSLTDSLPRSYSILPSFSLHLWWREVNCSTRAREKAWEGDRESCGMGREDRERWRGRYREGWGIDRWNESGKER